MKDSEVERYALLVASFIQRLDILMKQPSTEERGKKIAIMTNTIEMATDHVLHFELGLSFKQIENRKKKQSLAS